MTQSRLLSVLVDNKPGVLQRVASMIRRRGFNIDSLSVGPTEDDSISRMTITVHVGRQQAEQATKQLAKLIDVITIGPSTLSLLGISPSNQWAGAAAIVRMGDGSAQYDALFFVHVGDTRLYLIRDGQIHRVTRDHSYVSRLVESGLISPEQAETHPQRNILTAALGTNPDLINDDIGEN